MAFNLQKVLKALLFSSNQPLSVKDVQAAIERFHEQNKLPAASATEEGAEAEVPADGGPAVPAEGAEAEPAVSAEPASGDAAGVVAEAAVDGVPVAEPAEVVAEAPGLSDDSELYQDVPSLVTAAQIREAMDALAAEFKAGNDVFLLVEGPTGYRLVTHPRFARWIRILRDEPPPVRLTQSALETLAIIAYRQPVTRTEIETIRGVSAEAGLNKLLERELVYIVGRADLPGRPLQYGTTDKFLDFVGVKSLVELPSSDVLSPRQIDEWLQNAINPRPPTDAEMGLPLEEGTPAAEAPAPAEPSAEVQAAPETPAEEPREAAPANDAAPAAEDVPAKSEEPPASDQAAG